MQLGVYVDQTRCTGCFTCIVACKDWNDVPAGPASWMRVSTLERGKFPNTFVAFLPNLCYHCDQPLCVWVCPAKAITKNEQNGLVTIDREKCREASRCGIINEKAMGLSWRYGEGESPCQIACPAHLRVPGYVALIREGKFSEALHLIRQDMPLPSVCGRVCLAPCEKECRRQEVDQAIAIAALKRFVSDYVEENLPSPLPQTKGENVAIIGSGPAGLAAAYDLIRKGYGVTIYEASSVAGGMLVTGIPPYRLPKEILKRDIDYIEALGVQIKTNTSLGSSFALEDLGNQGYRAILLATGTQEGTKLRVPGADLKGTVVATSFLRDFSSGKKVEVGRRVAVIGGGNVAIDCARAALRLGASEVDLVCLESRPQMPAVVSEIEEAEAEGVRVHPSVTVTRVLGSKSKVRGIKCLNVRNVKFDENGEPHMEVLKGTEHVLTADMIIFAIGQKPNLSWLNGSKGVKISKRGTIVVDPETLATGDQGLFACGDVVKGPTSVIEAIASGQKAAFYIDRYLEGYMKKFPPVKTVEASDVKVEIPKDVEKQERQKMPCLPISERHLNFEEVALGYNSEAAMNEAKRCLNCAGHLCKDVCPYQAPQFGAEEMAKMQKCNLCAERWLSNQKPICVESCRTYALDAGPIEELIAKYGNFKEGEGFVYSPTACPSIVLKPKKMGG
jgi:NADPH-dependent glutamate synthase beta subunit-like oxidoreductase